MLSPATRTVCRSIIWLRLSTYSRGALAVGAASRACPARAHNWRCNCWPSAAAFRAAGLPGTDCDSAMLVSV